MGEAINLVENFKVEKVIFNCGEFNELEQDLIKVLDNKKIPYYSYIKELNIDDNKSYFLNNKDYDNENDNSNVIYTELNNYKFLLMGDAGVRNFDKFHNSGYKGLYNGETANDIAKRKKLRYREDILDNMGSDELIANLFRIFQTEQKLKNENIGVENEANKTHYEVGSEIRNTIKKLGGTISEDLPTPDKSLKELEKEAKKLKE